MAANGSSQGIGSLFTLIKRLEAATSRLEDIAVAQSGVVSPSLPSDATLSAVAVDAPAPAAPAAPAAPTSPSVIAFDELLSGPLAVFLKNAKIVGGPAATQAGHVEEAFKAQREFLVLAAACRKPDSPEVFMGLLKPTSDPLNKTVEVKDSNRGDKKQFNGLNAVAEGIPGLAWVTAETKPGPLVGEAKDSAQFWVNRVLKEHKDSEPTFVDWARSFITLLEDLRKYIMQHHTTALSWNAKGEDPTTFSSKAAAPTPAPSAGAPPPPPPPPGPPAPPPPPGPPAPPPPPPAGAAAAGGGGGMGAVFADLNKGESVTSGLRKVDKSEMTHKNPALRGNAPVPSSSAAGGSPPLGSKPVKPPKPQAMQKKPSKKALDGNKWAVEYFDGESNIVIDNTEINQIVNIFGCKNSTIQIKGKVNAVTLVSCTKTSVLLDSAVSSVAITSSPSFTVQILGRVPTIMIDATDGGQVFLSKDSLDVEIVTAKTSALNVSLPVPGEEQGIFEEKAVPEQLKTVVQNGKLVTTVLEHSG